MTEPIKHQAVIEWEGSWAEFTIERDWEGALQLEVSGQTGRAHAAVDVPGLKALRAFLDGVIATETSEATP